jgi:hypothetical protein
MKRYIKRIVILFSICFQIPVVFAASDFDYSACAYRPMYQADDPASATQMLATPETYYFKDKRLYFIAVDQCEKNVAIALGGKAKKKPGKVKYVNQYQPHSFGFPDGRMQFQQTLGIVAYVPSDWRGNALRGIGFTLFPPAAAEGVIEDDTFEDKVWVCRKSVAPSKFVFVPCASLPYENRR